VGYRQAQGRKRKHLQFTFFAMATGFIGGTSVLAPMFGIQLYPYGNFSIPIYALIITYAILRHQLTDIRIVIKKSLIYSLVVTALTAGYFGLIYGVERVVQTTFGYQSVWLSLSAFALMALVFQPLKLGIQRLVDRLFFHAPHEELVRRMERLEQEVRQAEKLKAVSTLAAGLAHEIKNPLTSIKTFTTYLLEKGTDPEFQRKFQRIVTHEVDKIDHIVHQLLDFAKPAPPKLEAVQTSRLLDETLDFLSNDCLKRRIAVERRYGSEVTIQGDSQQLRQVFLNLFLNSLEAMDGTGGTLSVATARKGSHLAVTIADTGPGIPKEHLPHLFDPFFTTKPRGTGLGLAVVQGIIQEHRGTITIDSHPGEGTRVRIEFPTER